jgi:hypothetical protein
MKFFLNSLANELRERENARWCGPRDGVSRVACTATHDVVGDGHILKRSSGQHYRRTFAIHCMHTAAHNISWVRRSLGGLCTAKNVLLKYYDFET